MRKVSPGEENQVAVVWCLRTDEAEEEHTCYNIIIIIRSPEKKQDEARFFNPILP